MGVDLSLETNMYDYVEIFPNCTVEILQNSVTGEKSIGWYENKNDWNTSDILPLPYEPLILACVNGGIRWVAIGYCVDGIFYEDTSDEPIELVTHWQYAPLIPKEEDEYEV